MENKSNLANLVLIGGFLSFSCCFSSCVPSSRIADLERQLEMERTQKIEYYEGQQQIKQQNETLRKQLYKEYEKLVYDQGIVLKGVTPLDVYFTAKLIAYSGEDINSKKDLHNAVNSFIYNPVSESKIPGIIRELTGGDGIVTQTDLLKIGRTKLGKLKEKINK